MSMLMNCADDQRLLSRDSTFRIQMTFLRRSTYSKVCSVSLTPFRFAVLSADHCPTSRGGDTSACLKLHLAGTLMEMT